MAQEAPFDLCVAVCLGTHTIEIGYIAIDTHEMHVINDLQTSPDIWLSHQGKCIGFGPHPAQQYLNELDEELSSDQDSDDEDSEDESDEEYNIIKSNESNILFKSFKKSIYNAVDDDLSLKIKCEDGREHKTSSVIIETLKYIKQETLKYLTVKFKNNDQMMDENKIKWVITVPSSWSYAAKHKLQIFAKKAGLISTKMEDQLQFIYETECALKSLCCDNINVNRIGHRYIIIDAGAGITDIGFYEIVDNDSVKEIYPPISKCLGSHIVDDYIEELFYEIFGKHMIHRFSKLYPSNYIELKNNFANSRSSFYDKSNAKYHDIKLTSTFIDFIAMKTEQEFCTLISSAKPFGLSNALSIDKDLLNISSKIWRLFLFDKVIDPLINQIENIITSKKLEIGHLVICGGLAVSKYFQHRIQETFGMNTKYKLSIERPKESILFTINGALQIAVNKKYVIARCARYSYGIAVDRAIKNVDLKRVPSGSDYIERESYWRPPSFRKRFVRNLFSTFVRKYQSLYTQNGIILQESINKYRTKLLITRYIGNIVPNDIIQLCFKYYFCAMDQIEMKKESITKKYRRFHKNEKCSKINLYRSDLEDPYVVDVKRGPFMSIEVIFEDDDDELKFEITFVFGTQLRIFAKQRQVILQYADAGLLDARCL